MRKRRLIYNTASSIVNQFITIISGFILPKLILTYYGSDVNGLVSSITQFLGFIALLDLGVGAVVQSAYYKPLADNDIRRTSLLFLNSRRFFRKIGLSLLAYVLLLCIFYPRFVITPFSDLYTVTLILAIAVSLFFQYFFAIPNQLILNADQRFYIQSNAQIVCIILNVIISTILILCGFSIQVVKLAASLIFVLRPIYLLFYVKKHYTIDYEVKDPLFKIEQKWNGLAQHFATVIMNSSGAVIISIFLTISDVSIYSIYLLVVNGLKQFVNSLADGFSSLLGNIIASGDREELKRTFSLFEWIVHNIVVWVYSVTGVLLVSFVMWYTSGIYDADYKQPSFSALLCLSYGIFCLRLPYNTIICSSGHFRQTQTSAIIEVLICIIASCLSVVRFGLVGISLGMLLAVVYRIIYFIKYIHGNILKYDYQRTIKLFINDLGIILLVIAVHTVLDNYIPISEVLLNLILHAFVLSIVSLIILFVLNYFFFNIEVRLVYKMLSHRS